VIFTPLIAAKYLSGGIHQKMEGLTRCKSMHILGQAEITNMFLVLLEKSSVPCSSQNLNSQGKTLVLRVMPNQVEAWFQDIVYHREPHGSSA
jgi:hypothetical protein